MDAIANGLLDPCREFFVYIRSLEKNIDSVETELGERTVCSGSRDLRAIESDVTCIHAGWDNKVRCLGDYSLSRYNLSKRAAVEREEAVKLNQTYALDGILRNLLFVEDNHRHGWSRKRQE